jgi:hypothetical protein
MDTLKMETAIIVPYTYSYMGQTQTVYVEKGKEHPDPFKRLTWGRDRNGEVITGNFNRFYTKAGKPIRVPYTTQGCRTATVKPSAG